MLSCSVLLLALSLPFISPSAPPQHPVAITGVVVDASGRPIPRAAITVVARDGRTAAVVFSDGEGGFRITGAPDGCRIHASLSGFQPAAADCRTDAPITLTLPIAGVAENIVVSATRTEAPSGQVASAVTVFDEAQIERRQAPPLAELLRSAPGTTVVRVGAPGAVTSLFVRAGESNYTKVLLDGVPLNEPGGAFNLSNITTENLDRVEFVRGAQSAMHGSDAMTGVIQLFTRRGRTPRPEFRLRAEGGTFSTTRGSAGLSAKAGPVDYSADITGFSTDNEVANNRFRNATLSGAAGAQLARGTTLRFIARAERGTTGVPGPTAFGRSDRDAFFRRHDSVWGAAFDHYAGALHHRASYGLAASDQASTNTGIDPPYTPAYQGRTAPFEFSDFPYDSRSKLRRHHASYQVDGTVAAGRAGTHVDTALIEWDGQRATLRDALAGTSVPASRDNVGVSLQHQALWSRVFVTAGVRFERNESFGDATTPRVAIAWYARTGDGAIGSTRLSAGAGRSIKEPTILQSFSPNPFFLGNPDLRPERIDRALEAGLEQRFANDRLRVAAVWFDNRYRDIIALTADRQTFQAQYFNIGLTIARGAELTADVVLVSGLRAKTGYTFADSEILESTSASAAFQVGNAAFRRPRHAGFINVAWSGARGSIDLAGTLVGERVDSDLSSLVPAMTFNERYTSWDLRASARVTRVFSLTGAIDNLSDTDRMEPLGYPVPGRAIRVGVRARF